jgi:hypothetical protein
MLSEKVEPRPRTCQCPRFVPVEDDRNERWRCLWCGRPHPKTARLHARAGQGGSRRNPRQRNFVSARGAVFGVGWLRNRGGCGAVAVQSVPLTQRF